MIRPVKKVDDLLPIKTAFISVFDKTGLDGLVFSLVSHNAGVKIISTGGTYTAIRKILGDEKADANLRAVLKCENVDFIDLVVTNLNPFQKVIIGSPTFEDVRDNIDIYDHSTLRAAAKNFSKVMILADPGKYESFINQMDFFAGKTGLSQRLIAARETFQMLGEYDTAIGEYMRGKYSQMKKCYEITPDSEDLGVSKPEELKK